MRVLMHYTDDDVVKIRGVNVNRLDTYNVAIQDLTVFEDAIESLDTFAALQVTVSRLPPDFKIVESMTAIDFKPAGCLSATVEVEYRCLDGISLEVRYSH